MRFFVLTPYVVKRYVGIDFGRRDVCVAKQRLHASEIRSAHQEVSREGVPELVWVDFPADADYTGVGSDDFPEALASQRSAAW